MQRESPLKVISGLLLSRYGRIVQVIFAVVVVDPEYQIFVAVNAMLVDHLLTERSKHRLTHYVIASRTRIDTLMILFPKHETGFYFELKISRPPAPSRFTSRHRRMRRWAMTPTVAGVREGFRVVAQTPAATPQERPSDDQLPLPLYRELANGDEDKKKRRADCKRLYHARGHRGNQPQEKPSLADQFAGKAATLEELNMIRDRWDSITAQKSRKKANKRARKREKQLNLLCDHHSQEGRCDDCRLLHLATDPSRMEEWIREAGKLHRLQQV